MILKVKKLHDDAKLPSFGRPGDAGMDLAAYMIDVNEMHVLSIVILPGDRALVRTGISIELPPGYEAQIRPRSGLAIKYGVTVLNTPGTIDEGYRGELGVILINHDKESFTVSHGMRIAQLVIKKCETVNIEEVFESTESQRGAGGFGSTGV